MEYKVITDDIIDEMLSDVYLIKINSYLKTIYEFSDN